MSDSKKDTNLTIVILDTHPIIRMGLAMLIRQNIDQVSVIEAKNIDEFKQEYEHIVPKLFISVLNENSRFKNKQLAIEIRSKFPYCYLIIYGEEEEMELAVSCLKSGVNGFLPKDSDLLELSNCISKVMSGENYLSPAYMSLLFTYLLEHHHIQRKKDLLTPRQFEVANYLVQGYSTSAIAQKIGLHISTISKFKSIIFLKLGVDSILSLKEIIIDENSDKD